MFRPIRRAEKTLDAESAAELLRTERRGVVAVNGDDGYPYAIPVNYLYDPQANKIYFHGARAGHKFDSIKACDKVCFTVFGNEQIKKEAWAPFMQSVVIFGRCSLPENTPEVNELLRRFASKYYPDDELIKKEMAAYNRTQLYVIDIEHMSAKEIQER